MNKASDGTQTNQHTIDFDTPVPDVLPILVIEGYVIYPYTSARMVIPAKRKKILDDAVIANGLIGVVAKAGSDSQDPGDAGDIGLGTMVRIGDVSPMPDGSFLASAKGLVRIRISDSVTTDPYRTARVDPAPETILNDIEAEALRRRLVEQALEVISLTAHIPDAVGELVQRITSPLKLAYLMAGNLEMEFAQRTAILSADTVEEKIHILRDVIHKELEVLRLNKSLDDQVKNEMNSKQREFHLRQKLNAIRKELGEDESESPELEVYAERIADSEMSAEARKEAQQGLKRLSALSPQSAEAPVIRNHLDWLLDLPWGLPGEIDIDLDKAQDALNEAHFGLEKVKERIIEYLAVSRQLKRRRKEASNDLATNESKGVIMCLTGPPGTGKTSLGKSIATAMGRTYTRMSLGGIRDESEIRGHRRTYVGAMPGRIIQAIKRAGTRNPVFVLDEIDKIGQDWRGDPSSALLEVLDPEQNAAFRDHYLDVDYDLSQVVFIATANQLETIPAALRDRMDIISLEGYTEYEKFQIAKHHLIPRQLEIHGLTEGEVNFMDEALRKIIAEYTREAGVRNLERHIGAICRKSIVALQKNDWHSMVVTADQVQVFLKKELFQNESAHEMGLPGIATGLAVTAAGGEILYIEATRMPGKGRLTLTGQLGDVMKESARIAHSYVRSRAQTLGIGPEMFETGDIHLHIPAGALPKDGPSAGVVMTLAIASAYTGHLVPGTLGVTGEVTLSGRVLPVGGIKMKILAAHRAGLTRVMIPKRNQRDIVEIPDEVRRAIRIELVDKVDQVLERVFGDSYRPGETAPDASTELHSAMDNEPLMDQTVLGRCETVI
jgi:ATP-dependent Lon protease